MTTPLRIVSDTDAPTLLVKAWEASMQGQGLSARTITERIRVINQITTTTGTDPAALTPQAISTWLATLPSAATNRVPVPKREAYDYVAAIEAVARQSAEAVR